VKGDMMDIQVKKGLLEMCVLRIMNDADSYGYKIVDDLSTYIEITESTLYPILKRLEIALCLRTYKEEHNGRLRKYYSITDIGRERLERYRMEAESIQTVINFILGGVKSEQ
jgi:PadR family transcriptional regulator PadR